jgi:hypothetical protein
MMKLPEYLKQSKLSELPLDYEWTRLIANSFQANPAESHPKLFDALQLVGVRAAFALGVACSEWVAARLEKQADASDAPHRIEAAWAATIDWRYASLPEPAPPDSGPNPDPVLEPLWLMLLVLGDDHQFYVKTYRGVKNRGVRGSALRLALLVEHITGRRSGFDKWLTASLRKARQHYPATDKPVEQEPPVPREFFEPDFKWTANATPESQARLLHTLNPAKNPYLRSREEMRADGFTGEPYPHLK